jgi:iron(III) transport system permease protein
MTQGRAPAPVRAKSWQGVLLASLAVGVVALSLVPLVAVFAGAFTQARGPVMHWGKWSTQSIERALSLAPEPILNSLMFAASATVLGTALALMVSYLVVKKKSRLSGVLDYVVVLPLTISGTVLGIALVQSFNTGPLVLTGTAAIMIVCYMVRRLPFGVRNASSVLYNLPGSIEEASISLGVSPFKTFFQVVLPVMKTSMLSAAILMWATSISELSASIVVYSGGLETLPIAILSPGGHRAAGAGLGLWGGAGGVDFGAGRAGRQVSQSEFVFSQIRNPRCSSVVSRIWLHWPWPLVWVAYWRSLWCCIRPTTPRPLAMRWQRPKRRCPACRSSPSRVAPAR